LLQVRGIVDIDCDSWKIQHDAWFAAGLRSGVMRFEAVVAEAQREKICWTAEGGVGAASVGGGDQHAAFGGRLLQNFFEFPGLN